MAVNLVLALKYVKFKYEKGNIFTLICMTIFVEIVQETYVVAVEKD